MSKSQRIFVVAALAVLLVSSSGVAQTRVMQGDDLPDLDAAARAAVVDSLTAVIDSVYVIEDGAKAIVAGLRANLAAGAYDDLIDPADFARRLTDDAQAIHHDGHFGIMALPPLDPEVVAARQDEDPADVERRRRAERARNYGFRKAEILPGGVGYLRFDQFSHGDDAFAAATAAMNFLANCDALILDVRWNGGGSAAMIRHLCGYLFEESVHLINWDIRARGITRQSHSPDYVPGRRMTGQPVYVLTSDRTFSAAEEFTFDLRNHERATVVGDTTGGGGHTVAGFDFAFDGFRMAIRVPYGRAYNPLNDEGWEGVGVQPHVAVPSEQALDAAHADALRSLVENEQDEQAKSVYVWALETIEARLDPVELSKNEMKAYEGNYGPRRIMREDDALWYRREGRDRHRLTPLGNDRFLVGDLDYFRLGFERDDDGRVVRVVGMYDNGRSDRNDRDR